MSTPDKDNRGSVALRVEMAARQLRQKDVAELIESDQGKVSLLRRGLALPNLRESVKLEEHLGIEAAWWLEPALMGSAPPAPHPSESSAGHESNEGKVA